MEISSFFEIFDLVGTIIGILASSNEVKTIFNIGIASKRHNEYLHSQRLWQNFQRVFYDKSTTQISSNTIRSFFNRTQINDELPLLKPDLFTEEREKQFRAAEHLRKLLIQYPEAACNAIVQHRDLLPRVVHLLDSANDNPKLQCEASWILTNVAASPKEEHTQHVIDAGAVAPLLRLLKSDSIELQEQCAWALNNITDYREICGQLLDAGVIDVIVKVLKEDKKIEAVRTCAMFYRSLCRQRGQDSFDILLPGIPHMIEQIMKDKRDIETCNQVGWALVRLWNFNQTTVYELLHNRPNAFQTLFELMKETVSAIKILGNIFCGTVEQTRAVLDLGFLTHAKSLLKTDDQVNVSEMLWALSNIALEPVFVQEFRDDGEIFPLVVELLKNPKSSVVVKSEALWVLANAMEGNTTPGLFEYLLGIGVLEPFYKELNQNGDSMLTEMMLGVLAEMLKFEQKGGVAVKAQLESWGVTKLLIEMSDDYEPASEILRNYFSDDF